MTDAKKLEDLKKKKLSIAMEACIASEKYSCRLKIILKHLDDISEKIIDHIENGDLSDQELNRKLWHRLYNVEHQIRQFSAYTENSTEEYYHASEELIQYLRDERPPKNLH